jgi:hypothetical protein
MQLIHPIQRDFLILAPGGCCCKFKPPASRVVVDTCSIQRLARILTSSSERANRLHQSNCPPCRMLS